MSDVVKQTQEAVYERMIDRLGAPSGLLFFTADTGLGKTTGFQLGIVRMRKELHSALRFLILVPTKKDADDCFQKMEELEPGCAGVWTESHDPERKVQDDRFEPAAYFTKSEAALKPVLIVTHNCGKAAERWVGRRDIVLIDENPQPVDSLTVWSSDFLKASEEEKSEPFDLAAHWALEIELEGIAPVGPPDCLDSVLAASPASPSGKKIQLLARKIKGGTAFQRKTHSVSWTGFSYDMPFADRAIVFSATAALEGWHLSPSTPDQISKDGPKVSYQNVNASYVPWPGGVSIYHREIIRDPEQIRLLKDYLVREVGSAGSETLFICPKGLELHLRQTFPEAYWTHWGVDVGSNAYRDCDRVWVVSEFHTPHDSLFARYLGHSKLKATDDTVQPGANGNSTTMRRMKDLHYRMYLKQMIARGSCRNVDSNGVAAPMEVHCMIDRERFATALPVLFPNCQLEYPEGHEFRPKRDRQNRSTVSQMMEYLPTVPKGEIELFADDLKAKGIDIAGTRKKGPLLKAQTEFSVHGWAFEPGRRGKGNAARMVRQKM